MDAPDECLGDSGKLPVEYIIDATLRKIDENLETSFICLYGLGRIGQAVLPYFKEYFKERLIYVSDNDKSKWGQLYSGCKCVPPEMISKTITVLVTTGYDSMVEIVAYMKKNGYSIVVPYSTV